MSTPIDALVALLSATALLSSLFAIAWTGMAWPGGLSIRASWRFALANGLFAVFFFLLSVRSGLPGYLTLHGCGLTLLLAFALIRDGAQILLRLRRTLGESALVVGLSVLGMAVFPPRSAAQQVTLVYLAGAATLALRCFFESLMQIRDEFGWRVALAPAAAFGLTTMTLFLRLAQAAFQSSAEINLRSDTLGPIWLAFVALAALNSGLMMLVLFRLVARIRSHAIHDALTGVLNRRGFDPRLRLEADRAARSRTPFAVICIDLDHFKRINDAFGHAGGDAVLIHVSKLIQGALRTIDVLGRIGGEEFVLVLPYTHSDGAVEVAQRLRALLEDNPTTCKGEVIRVTASFGVCDSRTETDPEQMLRRADAALYQAKEQGRNRVVCC